MLLAVLFLHLVTYFIFLDFWNGRKVSKYSTERRLTNEINDLVFQMICFDLNHKNSMFELKVPNESAICNFFAALLVDKNIVLFQMAHKKRVEKSTSASPITSRLDLIIKLHFHLKFIIEKFVDLLSESDFIFSKTFLFKTATADFSSLNTQQYSTY